MRTFADGVVVKLVLCGCLRLFMRVEKGKSTAEPSLATMSLDKQQTNKQCRAGRDVAGLDGKGAAEGANVGEPAKLVSYNRVRFEVKSD